MIANMTMRAKLSGENTGADTSKSVLGFWIYLMTDCILFASLFATYIVLQNGTFGGKSAAELFDLNFVLVETLLLLTSSFTCGLALLALYQRHIKYVYVLYSITLMLGLAFLGMELYEFSELVHEGNSWTRSAFLSAFFTLVGTHGLHISAGIIWLIILLMKLRQRGLSSGLVKRFTLFSLFWHFLDIVWIFIFTIVYLLGAIRL